MILDALHKLSDSQLFNTAAAVLSTNVIDLGGDRSIGNGEPMGVVVLVEVAADQGTGDEDYTFDLEAASNEAISAGRKLLGRRIFESGVPAAPAMDADLLVAGFKFVLPVPPGALSESERYLALRVTQVGTTPSITISAFLQPLSMIDAYVQHPDNITIS